MTLALEEGRTATARRITPAIWLALGLVYIVWGSTYLAIPVAIESIPPFTSAAVRFILAGAILAAFLAIRGGPAKLKVTRRQLASASLVGILLLLGGNAGVVLAERALPSGLAALLVAAVPLWVVVWRALARDLPSARTLLGIVIGFVGLAVLVLPGHHQGNNGHSYLGGVLLVCGAAISWSFGSVASSQWLTMPKDPFVATAYEMIAGGLACAIAAALHGEHPDFGAMTGRSLAATAYLVVFGSLVAFSAYVWLLHAAPISLVSTYAYVNPVVAVALGAMFVGEPVTSTVVLGGLIVL